jgi:dienelactone hydrolase
MKRKGLIAAFAALLMLAAVWIGMELSHPVRYTYDRNLPLNADVQFTRDFPLCRQYKVMFDSANGERVPALLCVPRAPDPPFPCIILLHGLGQDKSLIDDIHPRYVTGGYAMICIDSQYRGERERPGTSFISFNMFETRQTFAQTIVDARRAVDFLESRNEINPDQIVLLGASMGGVLGATAAGHEPRIRGALLLYAGGNLRRLLAESTIIYPRTTWWRSALAWGSGIVLREVDPLRHICQISPRPVLMINGSRDTVVPPRCAEELFAAAGEPKEIIWHDSDHIGLDGMELVEICIDESIAWFDKILGR